jgi:ADP-heptose:LPS heptosyltransferase
VERVLASLPPGSRVAVVRLRSLGDSVLTTPALDILKRFRPDLRIAVAVEDRFRAVFEGNPDLEAILPPAPGSVRRFHPALCLNFHGGTRSVWMTLFSGARWRAAFGHNRCQFAYNLRIPRAQEILGVDRKVHTAEHLASAIFYLGAPVCEIPRAKLFAQAPVPPGGPFAVIHAVAAAPEKTWPADHFLEIARRLRSSGLEPVFIGAASDDLARFDGYRALRGAPLSEVKSTLAAAAVFIGNDSGPAHMAAAFGIPSVVLFGPSDPVIWGPWRTPGQVLTLESGPADVIDALARLKVAA